MIFRLQSFRQAYRVPWDWFYMAMIYLVFFITNYKTVLFKGRDAFGSSDTIWWFGAFHYFMDSISFGTFPLWNPYSHGGEPFFFLYSMYRLLDPTILFPLLMSKIFGAELFGTYHWYYILRHFVHLMGIFYLFKVIFKNSQLAIVLSVAHLFMTQLSVESMFRIDAVAWIPWIMMGFVLIYQNPVRRNFILTAYFIGVNIGTTSYHFIFFTLGLFFFLGLFILVDFRRAKALIRDHWKSVGLSIVVIAGLASPLLAVFLNKDLIFPVARAFGNRDAFIKFFLETGSLFQDYAQSYLARSKYTPTTSDVTWLYRILAGGVHATTYPVCLIAVVWSFFMFHGLIGSSFRFKWSLFATCVLLALCSLASVTPVHQWLFYNFPLVAMARHTIGYTHALEVPLTIFVGFGIVAFQDPVRSRIIDWLGILLALAMVYYVCSSYDPIHHRAIYHMAPVIIALGIFRNQIRKQGVKWAVYTITFLSCLWLWILFKPALLTRTEAINAEQGIYPLKFFPRPLEFDPERTLALERPAYLLFDPMIRHKDAALTTVLEPKAGQTLDDISYLQIWKVGSPMMRVIYWPIAYLNAYLSGEPVADPFYDRLGIDREKIRFYPVARALRLSAEETEKVYSTFNYRPSPTLPVGHRRLSDKFLILNSGEFAAPPTASLAEWETLSPVDPIQYSVKRFGANFIELDIVTPESGILLYNDTFDSNWRVQVNGTQQELLKANGGFKAVQVPRGSSVVEFYYRPWSVMISIALYVAISMTLVIYFWRRRFEPLQKSEL